MNRRNHGLTIFVLALLVASSASGNLARSQPAGEAAKQPVEFLHTEIDAVGWAFDALTKYTPESRPYIRFVWIPPWADPEWLGVVDFAVNSACSHTPILVRGDRHAGGWLLAYNLERLAPEPRQRDKLVEVWDSLATRESRFHVPEINVQTVGSGRDARRVERRVALLAPHLQEALARHVEDAERSQRIDVLVTQITQSSGAIYPADFLIEQLLTSVRGKYPEFRQQEFGAGSYKKLLTQRGFYFGTTRDLRGDRGALLLASGVTGKSRIVMTMYGLASRQPLAVTFDFNDERTRPDQQFIRNLIEFEPLSDASEALIPMANGLIEYAIANAAGELQRVVPPDVAADFTKPDGHTKELEPGMSCIICHAPDSGYRTASNDMEFLLGADADFFGDAFYYTDSSGKRHALSREEAVAIVAGRYGERIDEPDGVIGRARRDYLRALDAVTDYDVTADGASMSKRLGDKLKEIYHGYRYRRIDAQRACLELGVKVEDAATAREWLRKLVPPPPAGETEDIVISLLRNGASIKRDDMDAIYVEMARRAAVTREGLREEVKSGS